jgi:hypothetical protein
MRAFTVHWSPVVHDHAQRYAPEGAMLFALWPAPMNHDQCFIDAGFTDFDDADDAWDFNADGLLSRLLDHLSRYGSARLVSEPAVRIQPWYRRLFAEPRPEPIDVREQIVAPMSNKLPDCIVSFGDAGVSLRTGREHHVFWISLPEQESVLFERAVGRIAGPHPTVRTKLKWEHLL